MKQPPHKTPGQFADEFIANPHRLAIAHSMLALVVAIVYWVRPGTFTPHLPTHPHGADITPILQTFIAWSPYVISATVSRRILGVRDKRATIFFIVMATAITAMSLGFYLNLFVIRSPAAPIVISAAVAGALLSSCGLCAVIWPNDAPE